MTTSALPPEPTSGATVDHAVTIADTDAEIRDAVLRRTSGDDVVELVLTDAAGTPIARGTGYDAEAALVDLRTALDADGIRMLVNRYRRDAFVSSMARQMSGGLGCYLVENAVAVKPESIVDALGVAPLDAIATAEVNERHIAAWIASFDD